MEYSTNFQINEIWNETNKIIPFLKEWVQSQRWGEKNVLAKRKLLIKDEFFIYSSDQNKIIGLLLELNSQETQNVSLTYFIPLEISRNAQKIKKFPITLKCQDGNLFFQPAESNPQFFDTIFKDLVNESKITTLNSNLIIFKLFSPLKNRELRLKADMLLGNGDTTNTLYKLIWADNSKWVCKIFRLLSKNPEVKMLKMLYSEGFHQLPRPLGTINIKIGKLIYPLILFSEFIEAKGDGGLFFWNNLNSHLFNWTNGCEVQQNLLEDYCQTLGETVADLHFYSAKIKDALFEPAIISQGDVKKWKDKIKHLFEVSYKNLNVEHAKTPNLQSYLNKLSIYLDQILNTNSWNLLEGLKKIKIHQDLHLAQMLTIESSNKISFIILDFEGDPLLNIKEKFQKDPIFRDLASIYSAFHYIKYNALNDYFRKNLETRNENFTKYYLKVLDSFQNLPNNRNTHFLNRISFAKQWEVFCQNSFLNSYIRQLKKRKITFNLDLSNINQLKDILRLFRFERFIKELYYEILFRKTNFIIPLMGLFELQLEFLRLIG